MGVVFGMSTVILVGCSTVKIDLVRVGRGVGDGVLLEVVEVRVLNLPYSINFSLNSQKTRGY
jgi:hypothetical protein